MKPLLLLLGAAAAFAADPPEPKFTPQDLDRAVQIGYGVAVADVDGDKLPDILLADKTQFRWYKNPGKRGVEWPRYVLAENLTKNDNVCLAAQDIDGDGKCEIAVGAEWNPGDTVNSGAVFYLIPPADRTQPWTPVKFPKVEPVTHRMRWLCLQAAVPADGDRPAAPAQWGLVVVPLHGRGNKDGAGAGAKVFLYHPPTPLNDPKGEWKSELMDDSMHLTHNFQLTHSVLAKAVRGPTIPLSAGILLIGKEGIANVESRNGSWHGVKVIGADDAGGSPAMTVPEFKGGGEIRWLGLERFPGSFATVEPMHGSQLVVYLASRDAGTRHVLTDKLIQGHALACGDVLGVGSDQIVVGWRGNLPPKPDDKVGIAVWTPMDAACEHWRETLIDDGQTACEDLTLADLDGDGKLDVVAAGRATHNLRIYWNAR